MQLLRSFEGPDSFQIEFNAAIFLSNGDLRQAQLSFFFFSFFDPAPVKVLWMCARSLPPAIGQSNTSRHTHSWWIILLLHISTVYFAAMKDTMIAAVITSQSVKILPHTNSCAGSLAFNRNHISSSHWYLKQHTLIYDHVYCNFQYKQYIPVQTIQEENKK